MLRSLVGRVGTELLAQLIAIEDTENAVCLRLQRAIRGLDSGYTATGGS